MIKKIFTLLKVFMTLSLIVFFGSSHMYAAEGDITVTIEYSNIPDGFSSNGTNGEFTLTVGGKSFKFGYEGINTKSKSTDSDHKYGYAMFVKNYGHIFSKDCPSGYYPSEVTATFTSGTGTSGKAGITFGASSITTRNSNVSGSVSKGGTSTSTNGNESNTHWNFSTTGANVQVTQIEIVYSQKSVPTATYTVTLDPGNGTCEKQSITESSAGAGIELPACTPTSSDYAFIGWASTQGATIADIGKEGVTYHPTSDCTIYAVYSQLYTVTIESPENGSLVVKKGGTDVVSGSKFVNGTVLTIEATPDNNYKFRNWQAIDATTHTYSASNTGNYTINDHNVTFEANFDPLATYTINYMVNGVNTGAQENVYEGTTLAFPTVNAFGGKVFVGWSETEITEATDVKPTLVETAGLTATENATYYAVFAKFEKGNSTTTTDVIDHEFAGVENQDDGNGNLTKVVYTDWSDKEGTSGAVYAGQTAGDKNSVQMRSNNNNSGIITTTSGGKIKSVTVDWNSETADGRVLNIYGKGSAYTSPTELYGETSGELLGTIVNGTSTTLNITGDYEYIGFRSNSGAMYLTSISIAWEQGTPDRYSAYCTTVTPLAQNVTITDAGWATACLPFNATVSDNATAYYVTTSGSTLNKVKANVIPAGEGVLLKRNEGGAATVTFTETAVAADEIEANYMLGSVEVKVFDESGFKYYILANGKNGLGFYYQGTENDGSTVTCAAGKAILAVPTTSSAKAFFSLDNEPTGIESLTPALSEGKGVYNLNGMKVNEAYKGIVIMNGKKYINK